MGFGQGDPEELFAQVDQLVRKVAAKADAYQQAANSPLNDPALLWADVLSELRYELSLAP